MNVYPMDFLRPGAFQKSKSFLFPATGIEPNQYTKEIITFVAWQDHFSVADCRLTAVRTGALDGAYRIYEQDIILKNPLFEQVHYLNEFTVAYVFNFDPYGKDWELFLQGRYSKLSTKLKNQIKDYFGVDTLQWEYIKAYLYPEIYFEQVAAELWYPKEQERGLQLLEATGELCDLYDPQQELFTVLPNLAEMSAEGI